MLYINVFSVIWHLRISAPLMAASQEDSVNATHLSLQQVDRGNVGSTPEQLHC